MPENLDTCREFLPDDQVASFAPSGARYHMPVFREIFEPDYLEDGRRNFYGDTMVSVLPINSGAARLVLVSRYSGDGPGIDQAIALIREHGHIHRKLYEQVDLPLQAIERQLAEPLSHLAADLDRDTFKTHLAGKREEILLTQAGLLERLQASDLGLAKYRLDNEHFKPYAVRVEKPYDLRVENEDGKSTHVLRDGWPGTTVHHKQARWPQEYCGYSSSTRGRRLRNFFDNLTK